MNIRRIREKICCLQDQVVSLDLDPQVGLPPAGSSLNAYQRRVCCLEQLANLDEDALDWILRVEEQDAQPLENAVRLAMNRLVVSAKTRGVWDENAQLTVAAGARTLDGALVPLRGSALTNFNFVSGDYTRKGGLKGDGATKYLQGVTVNTLPQNDFLLGAYLTEAASTNPVNEWFYGNGGGLGAVHVAKAAAGSLLTRQKTASSASIIGEGVTVGFKGVARNNPNSYDVISSGVVLTRNLSSDGNSTATIFGSAANTTTAFTTARISIYLYQHYAAPSIWDQILTQYHAELAAAIL